MAGVTDASWQAFPDNAKNIGVEKYIGYCQTALDQHFASQK